ncbi:MAG TPA: hypothetical protein VK908_00275 [Jiangellales bacterium]|nr:hypothetical protein [Jiangellales bacterium]
MDWKLEVVVVPVTDVAPAKGFYVRHPRVPARHRPQRRRRHDARPRPRRPGLRLYIFFEDPDGNSFAVQQVRYPVR